MIEGAGEIEKGRKRKCTYRHYKSPAVIPHAQATPSPLGQNQQVETGQNSPFRRLR
jgi:hypothetical protein